MVVYTLAAWYFWEQFMDHYSLEIAGADENFWGRENQNACKAAIRQKPARNAPRFLCASRSVCLGRLVLVWFVLQTELEKELYAILGWLGWLVMVIIQLDLPGAWGWRTKTGWLKSYRYSEHTKTMGQLAVVQFFSWFCTFAMWLYHRRLPSIFTKPPTQHRLCTTRGANWVGVLFGIYNGFAAVVAFGLPVRGPLYQPKNHTRHCACNRRAWVVVLVCLNPYLLLWSPMVAIRG